MRMPIPNDWTGEYCKFSICWPNSEKWRGILRGLITEAARGFFWDERTGSVVGAQLAVKETFDYNLRLWEVIMACESADALASLSASINNLASRLSGGGMSSCCADELVSSGGGISGSYTDPTLGEFPIFGTEPPLFIEPETFPDGYEDLTEYRVDKCEVANLIVSGAVGSLRGLGALGVFNYIALAGLVVLAITGMIVFPPAFVPMAALALGFLAAEVTVLSELADYIEENREDWVCAMYNADGVEDALAAIAELLDVAIGLLSLDGAIGAAVKTIGLLMFNGDTLNQLFKKTAHLTYAGADCSACEEGCTEPLFADIAFGEVTDGAFATCGVTMVSDNVGGGLNRIDFNLFEDSGFTTPAEVTVTNFLSSPDPVGDPPGGGDRYRFYNAALSLVYSSDTPPTLPLANVHALSITSSSAGFHIDFGW